MRRALGARPAQLYRMVLRRALRLSAAGVAVGIAAALLSARLLESLVHGVSAADPASFVGAALLVSAVAPAVGQLPARRATQVDPMRALRGE